MKSVSIGPKAKISIYSMSVYGYVSESELLCGEMVYVCRHDNLTQIASWILLPPMLSLFSTNDAWGEERRETVNRGEGRGGETEREEQ